MEDISLLCKITTRYDQLFSTNVGKYRPEKLGNGHLSRSESLCYSKLYPINSPMKT